MRYATESVGPNVQNGYFLKQPEGKLANKKNEYDPRFESQEPLDYDICGVWIERNRHIFAMKQWAKYFRFRLEGLRRTTYFAI